MSHSKTHKGILTGLRVESLTATLSFGSPELGLAPPSVSIQGMGRNITLVERRLCWSDALLYCRDFHWDLLSLRDPEDQELIDELVAGAPFPLTSHLWVGLRRYWPDLSVRRYRLSIYHFVLLIMIMIMFLPCKKQKLNIWPHYSSFHASNFNLFKC